MASIKKTVNKNLFMLGWIAIFFQFVCLSYQLVYGILFFLFLNISFMVLAVVSFFGSISVEDRK